MGFLVTANAKLLAQLWIHQKCIMMKPRRKKVLHVTSPQAYRLDLFWGSGFPKKRLGPCKGTQPAACGPPGGGVALRKQASLCTQPRLVWDTCIPCPHGPVPVLGSLGHFVTPAGLEGQGLGSLATSEMLP